MQFSELVMDHFHSPRNAYRMKSPDVVGEAGAGKPGRGPFMILFLRVKGDLIQEASFLTYGCCPAIAPGSFLVERLSGVTREEARRWTEAAIDSALGGLPRHKRHCTRLTAEALQDALAKWPGPTAGSQAMGP